MKACTCRHLGHCPFHKPDSRRTDLDGRPLWRELTGEEQAQADVLGEDAIQIGDLCNESEDVVRITGRAIEPERAVAYAKSKEGRRCKADRFMWRLRHPVPEAS